MKIQVQDYKDMVATPEAHLEFLRHATQLAEGIEGTGQDVARKLNTALRESIEVAGQPFTQARHLVQLERHSDGWDLEGTKPEVLREVIQLSEGLKAVDAGLDLPHFTTGFEWMRELAGGPEVAPSR